MAAFYRETFKSRETRQANEIFHIRLKTAGQAETRADLRKTFNSTYSVPNSTEMFHLRYLQCNIGLNLIKFLWPNCSQKEQPNKNILNFHFRATKI